MKRVFSVLFSLILIIGFGYLIYFLGKEFIDIFSNSDSKTSVAIITAGATIFVGIGVAVYSQHNLKKRELEEAHRESKIELYNRFISFMVKIIAGSNKMTSTKMPSEKEMIDFMIDFKRDVLLRASPEVVKALIEYETNAENSTKVFESVDKLYRFMRKDIGLSNKGLNDYELIQIFIKDKSEIKQLIKN